MKCAVILPTYNEAENIAAMLKNLRAVQNGLEIIVCDDHSPDGTAETARAADPAARVLLHEGPKGLSHSVVQGFQSADAEILICMDSDGQHRPEDLPAVIAAAEQHGFAVGSRFVPGGGFTERWNPFRLFVSRASALLAKLFLGTKLRDPMSGFFAVKREIFLRALPHLNPTGFKIMLEMAAIATAQNPALKIQEVPIRFALRQAGESKTSFRVARQYLRMLFECRKTCRALRRKEHCGK